MSSFFLGFLLLGLESGVREVRASACDVIPVRLSLGITTQLIFDRKPSLSLLADQKHFKIESAPTVPRSLAIIPQFESNELEALSQSQEATVPSKKVLAQRLDLHFRTNLFVFFSQSGQLMFELRFVPPENADYVLKIREEFSQECQL